LNAKDLVSTLRSKGPQDLNVIFQFLADNLYHLNLRTRLKVFTLGDVKGFLEECADEASPSRFPDSTKGSISADACPRCGHVHEGVIECGFEYSPGRICRCELDATA
jgi:hypothetical protein